MRMLVEEGSAIAPLSARFARASNCVSFALALLKGRAEQLPPAQAFELLSVVDNVARMQPRLGEWVARQSHYADPRSTRAVLEDALRFQAESLRQLVQLSGSMGWTPMPARSKLRPWTSLRLKRRWFHATPLPLTRLGPARKRTSTS